jgi:hypothetical protein
MRFGSPARLLIGPRILGDCNAERAVAGCAVRRRHGVALAVALSTASMPVHAEAPQTLPAVDVVEKYDNPVGVFDAASQGTVTGSGIRRRPLERPGEVLESVPGLIVTQHSGDGKANQFFLRGYNLDHGTDFATWVAGMPVNMPTHAHGQGYTDLNFLIPELIERIDYSKGPYYAENGDFSSVGVARMAYFYRLPANLALASVGSFQYGRALLAGSPEVGNGNLLYALEYATTDGPWEHPQSLDKYNVVLQYAQGTPANGFNLTGMAYKANWNSTDQIPLRAVNDGMLSRFGAIDATDGGSSSRYSVSGQWNRSEGNVMQAATLYAVWSSLDLFSNFTYFLDDPVHGDQFNQSERRFLFGGEVSSTWFGLWGDRQMYNTLGLQGRRDRLTPVGLYLTAARERLSTTREDQVTVANLSPYFANRFQWTDWFRTIAGVRADFFRFEVDSNIEANSGSESQSKVSPKFSAIFGPWANTEYFVNWGQGFHSNDARGTTTRVDPKTGDPVQPVSPLVRTTGYEIGVRSAPTAGLTGSLALWELSQDSELLFIGDAGTTEASRPSKRTGVELLAQFVPRPGLSLDLTAAYTKARFTGDDPTDAGKHVPGAPQSVASAGVTYDAGEGWFGAIRWRYFGPRPLDESGDVRSSSTSLTNARLGYAFNSSSRLWLDVFNLFDRKDDDVSYYYVSRLPGEPPEGIADVHFHPVESRAVRLTLSLAY